MVNLKLTSDGEHLTMTEEMGIWPPGDIWPSLVFLSHQTSLSQSALPTPSALICLTRGMKLLLRQASHNQTQLITVSCTPRSHSHYTQHSWCYRKKDIHSALLWSQQAVHAALTLSVLRRRYDVQGNPTDLFKSGGKPGVFPSSYRMGRDEKWAVGKETFQKGWYTKMPQFASSLYLVGSPWKLNG